MLTQKQKNLLMFINERLKSDGVPPSFDEMKDALDLKSKSGIHRLITALEERGFIRRLPHKARALEILKLPDSETAGNTGGTPSRCNRSLMNIRRFFCFCVNIGTRLYFWPHIVLALVCPTLKQPATPAASNPNFSMAD